MRRPTVGAAVPAARTGLAVESCRERERSKRDSWDTRDDRDCRGCRVRPSRPVWRLMVRAAGDCRPYHWVGGGACEASGETLVEPLSSIGVC